MRERERRKTKIGQRLNREGANEISSMKQIGEKTRKRKKLMNL